MKAPDIVRSAARGLVIALLVLLLGVVSVGGAVALFYTFVALEDVYLSESSLNSAIAAAGVGLLVLALAVSVLVLYAVARLFWRHRQVFGTGPAERLIALGVAALVFPRTIYAAVVQPIRFLTGLASNLPARLGEFWIRGDTEGTTGYAIDEFFGRLLSLVQFFAVEAARALEGFVVSLPVRELLLALALFVLVGQLLSASPTPTEEGREPLWRSRLGSFFSRLSLAQRRNLALLAVFLVSAYLSIAAIVTIPWLRQQESPEALSRAQLESRLRATVLAAEEFNQRFPENPGTAAEPMTSLMAALDSATAQLERIATQASGLDDYRAEWGRRMNDLRSDAASTSEMHAAMLTLWRQQRNRAVQTQRNMIENTLSDFEVDVSAPMTAQERAYYFRSVDQWFRSSVSTLYRTLSNMIEYLSFMDWTIERWIDDVRSSVEDELRAVSRYARDPTQPLDSPFRWSYPTAPSVLFADADVFRLPASLEFRPTPPDPGSGWGFFGWVARWLLRTKSLALTLITGMLGFGLLGSAIASFVREPRGAPDSEGIVRDIPAVLIRGLSAAVVIFLAVMGSLALFSTGEQEPDPYVLFFACLVGAVFSEDVWRWARRRFRESLPGTGNARPPPEKGSGTEEDKN